MKTSFTSSAVRRKYFLPLAMILYCSTAYATTFTIHVANFSFTPATTIVATVGDTIIWTWVSGSHTTTSTSVPAGAATWNSPINSSNTSFHYVATVPGTYNFKCSMHPSVMIGTFNVGAATPLTTEFQKGYGLADSTSDAAGSGVQQTFDGGFITTGYISNFGGGDDDFYLIKTDSNGNAAWAKSYGGSSADDANYVVQTMDSGYAMVGPTYSYGGQAILLVKTDASGAMGWAKTYGTGDTLSDASASAFKQTADGGFIITGYISNVGAGGDDFYLVKTDASGNIQWTRSYGGAGGDDANSVAITADGGYIICGTTTSFADSTGDIYLIKTDQNGNLQWSRDFGSNDGMDMANSVQQTADNGYIIAGVTMGPAFGEFATLIKTDSSGQIVWTKAFGTDSATSDASAASVEQTNDGGYILTGYISNFGAGDDDYYLVKTNASGDLSWATTCGSAGADDALFVKETSDGGYIVSGKTFGFPSSGSGQHLYMVKTDPSGNSSCNQYTTGTVVNDSVTFSSYPTTDSVSTGGVATAVTPTVSSGSIAEDLCSVSGIREATTPMELNVYPNPSSGLFQITGSKLIKSLEVYDVMGARIYAAEINSDRTELNLSGRAKGIYFIRLLGENETGTLKVVLGN